MGKKVGIALGVIVAALVGVSAFSKMLGKVPAMLPILPPNSPSRTAVISAMGVMFPGTRALLGPMPSFRHFRSAVVAAGRW